MLKIKEVTAGPGFNLALKFSDGTRGIADMRALLEMPPFKKLRVEKEFLQAYVDHGAVEWPSGVGVATETLYAMAHDLKRPESVADVEANELEMSLRELRKLAGITQVEAASALEIDQGQLSRFERQEDMKLSSLRRYVEALGGELELVAVVGDKRITLRGV